MAGTRPAVGDGQHGSRGGGDDSREHEPKRRKQSPRQQQLGRWSTGAPTDADVAAGQQGAGSSLGHRARSLT